MSCEKAARALPAKRTKQTGEERLGVVKATAFLGFSKQKVGGEVGGSQESTVSEVVTADAGWYLFSPRVQSVRNTSKKKKKKKRYIKCV